MKKTQKIELVDNLGEHNSEKMQHDNKKATEESSNRPC